MAISESLVTEWRQCNRQRHKSRGTYQHPDPRTFWLRCHGFDARGNDETGAPDLTGTLRRASSDAGIFNIIREGIPGTAMLPVAADVPNPTVWQLVAYINSLRYDPASVDLAGNASSGADLFGGKGECSNCHMVNGQGGRLGPDLSRVGENQTPEDLLQSMLDPRWIRDLRLPSELHESHQ